MTSVSWGNRSEQHSYAAFLTALVAVAHFAVIPYSTQFTSQLPGARQLTLPSHAFGALLNIGLSYLLIRLSLNLGRRVGLGWPPIDGWDRHAPSPPRIRQTILAAALLAAAVALPLVIAATLFGDQWPMREMENPTVWAAALVSLGAGIYEEVWFRLGAMTILAWLMTKVSGRFFSGSSMLWTANVLAALLFGAVHLPQAAAISTATLTPSLIAFVLAANGAVGVACGWLYWRRGLLSAMIAHTTVNLVLKVAFPLVSA